MRLTIAIVAGGLCGPASAGAQGRGPFPQPIPVVHGPLRIVVAYPTAGSAIAFGDSTFLFGTVGDSSATLTVAGQSVAVAANGAWLAWVALPHDSALAVRLVAHAGLDSATAVLHLTRAAWVRESGPWVDLTSRTPVGRVWLPKGEPLPLTVRAAPGAIVRLLLPGGKVLRFAPDSMVPPPPAGELAFGGEGRRLDAAPIGDRYVATLLSDLAPLSDGARFLEARAEPPSLAAAQPVLEVALHGKVSHTPWPIHVTRLGGGTVAVLVDNDSARRGVISPIVTGRAFPAGTYAWFLPVGTRARADMRTEDQVRLRLSHDAVAWVPISDVHLVATPDDRRPAIVGSLTLVTDSIGTRLRIPLTHPVAHRVAETERGLVITLFDAVSDANWTRYGAGQEFAQTLTWAQDAEDRVTLAVNFDRPLWGWRVRVDGTDLVFDFRAPPPIDLDQPLHGRRIVIDPGHPPGGACGPTGLCEPEANLNVANVVRDLLTAAGATVIMTRTGPGDVGLWPRVAHADSVDADLLVSIHNNALPDGLNPFTNSGTSTFFNHLPSLDLARSVQARLVANLGLRDLGVARGDLALVRPTWYPAILTEGLFLMVPEQEATLRTAEGQRRYATGVVEGIAAFLKSAGASLGVRPSR